MALLFLKQKLFPSQEYQKLPSQYNRASKRMETTLTLPVQVNPCSPASRMKRQSAGIRIKTWSPRVAVPMILSAAP